MPMAIGMIDCRPSLAISNKYFTHSYGLLPHFAPRNYIKIRLSVQTQNDLSGGSLKASFTDHGIILKVDL